MAAQGTIAIRTHGGAAIGLGHVKRCITLAHALAGLGADVRFILNDDRGALELTSREGFAATAAAEDRNGTETAELVAQYEAAAVVCDSYQFDTAYLDKLVYRVGTIVVLDDLADRLLPVSLVVNGSAHARSLVYRTVPGTRLLLGPEYILLRPEFSLPPNRTIRRCVERVLITTGGTDQFVLAPCLVKWSRELLPEAVLDVIIGPFFPEQSLRRLVALAEADRAITLFHDPAGMRDLMLASDLAITAGGQTVYELAATATPTVAIRLADNQTGNLSGLQQRGALIWAADAGDQDLASKVVSSVRLLTGDQRARIAMSRAQRALVDGCGAQRVAQSIMALARC